MNTPNKLTVARIIATPVFMVAMLIEFPFHYTVSLILFAAASLTDMIDGKLARKNHLVTDFGKFLDPLADKMLTTAAYLGFISMFADKKALCIQVTAITFLVLFREFLVSSLRLVVVTSGGKVIAANIWGKAKTVSQMVSIVLALFVYGLSEFVKLSNPLINALDAVIILLFWVTAVLCTVSGAIYLTGNKSVINSSK